MLNSHYRFVCRNTNPEAGLDKVDLYAPRPDALRTQRRNEVRSDYAEYLAGYKRVVNQRFGAMVWSEVKNDAFECFTWQQIDPERMALEVGRRRLPDMDAETWRSGNPDRDDWWESAFCKSCVIKVGDGYIDSIRDFIAENSRA